MANTNGSANYQRGVASLVLLALLKQQDMYGYQLVQEAEKQSKGALIMQEGSLYPVLYRLLDAGYITDRKVLVGKRMTRIYYHLELEGAEYLQALISEYRAVTNGVFSIVEGGRFGGDDGWKR